MTEKEIIPFGSYFFEWKWMKKHKIHRVNINLNRFKNISQQISLWHLSKITGIEWPDDNLDSESVLTF